MKPDNTLCCAAHAPLANGPLSMCVVSFKSHLQGRHYAATTVHRMLSGLSHFSVWMEDSGLTLQDIDNQLVTEFLTNHLPRCTCPYPVMRSLDTVRAALGHLVLYLRAEGCISDVPSEVGEVIEELQQFDSYMKNARGLAAGTRRNRLRIIRQLLDGKFQDGPIVITSLEPDDLRQFITERLKLHPTTSNATNTASTLRAYLRYRITCGDSVHGLFGVICSPAHWSMATLPKTLSVAEVDALLASFTSEMPSPLRGLAMVRCALDMGLRSIEVAQLQLDDIDWRSGIVTLNKTKSRRQDILPLPQLTGQALADYISNERPVTSNRAIFVRCRAPRDLPIGADAVRRVIRDAFKRIGLSHGRSHALRHTMANRLLEGGSSLKEVADVLRHRSLNTSLIYAKLDTPRLLDVALPWPGCAQ